MRHVQPFMITLGKPIITLSEGVILDAVNFIFSVKIVLLADVLQDRPTLDKFQAIDFHHGNLLKHEISICTNKAVSD